MDSFRPLLDTKAFVLSVEPAMAWAVAHLGSRTLNRSMRTKHRGHLLIHASKSKKNYHQHRSEIENMGYECPEWKDLPKGVVVAQCFITECSNEKANTDCGWGMAGYYWWHLDGVELVEQFPLKGRSGLPNLVDLDKEAKEAETFQTHISRPTEGEKVQRDKPDDVENISLCTEDDEEVQRDNPDNVENISLCTEDDEEVQRDNPDDVENISLCTENDELQREKEVQRESPNLSDPITKKRREKGFGSGRIEWILCRGKYKQAFFQYELWRGGTRLVKDSKYIPKKKLTKVQRLQEEKAPVREILDVLGVKYE